MTYNHFPRYHMILNMDAILPLFFWLKCILCLMSKQVSILWSCSVLLFSLSQATKWEVMLGLSYRFYGFYTKVNLCCWRIQLRKMLNSAVSNTGMNGANFSVWCFTEYISIQYKVKKTLQFIVILDVTLLFFVELCWLHDHGKIFHHRLQQ